MKILLIADIGGAPKGYPHINFPKSFFHVGDEAIFKAAYEWYKKNESDCEISFLTWKRTYNSIRGRAFPHLVWPTKRILNRLYFFTLSAKLLLFVATGVSLFSQSEERLIQVVRSHDRIHFIGGGNINSLYPAWLYYVNFLLFASLVCGKDIVLTSQSIGPFKPVDSVVTHLLMKSARIIGVREDKNTQFRPMLDIAYSELKKPTQRKKRNNKPVVGLSLHPLANNGLEDISIFGIRLIRTLSVKCDCTFIFIPHLLGGKNYGDRALFARIHKAVGNQIKLAHIDHADPVSSVQKATAGTDLLISTRYHGLVFALSQNVPVVSVISDSYYDLKNSQLLKLVYKKKAHLYTIDLRKGSAYENVIPTVQSIIENTAIEKSRLTRINRRLRSDPALFRMRDLKTFPLKALSTSNQANIFTLLSFLHQK